MKTSLTSTGSAEDIGGDQQASELILINAPSQSKEFRKCSSAKALWGKLKEIHARKGPTRKANLLKKVILTKLKGNDVRTHLKKFMDTFDKLSDMDVNINED